MRPVERVLECLEGVRTNGDGWSACCPAHDDRRASLAVSEGSEEQALLFCRAGCEQADILSALGPLGLDAADLFERTNGDGPFTARRNMARGGELSARKAKPKAGPAPLPAEATLTGWQKNLTGNEAVLARLWELKAWDPMHLEALGIGFDGERLTFPIRNAEGELVNLNRYRPGGNGTKMLALRGRARDLFPAPEALEKLERPKAAERKAAGRPPRTEENFSSVPKPSRYERTGKVCDLVGEVLFLVEGEPDAISAAELGLSAVAVPGVQGWRKGWTSRFTGREVVVCFDADAPGRKAAVKVEADLKAAGVEATVLDLADDRTDGYDLGDYLLEAAKGGQEEVRQAGRALLSAAAHARTQGAEPARAQHTEGTARPPEPPDTAELLEDVAGLIRRFVVLTNEQRDAIALWVLHAHALDAADTTPYLAITSAEKRSGKSRCMEVLAQLVPNPIEAANISEAALFRALGSGAVSTLLFDEIDATFGPKARDKEDLRALVNAGYRRGARAYRCVGDGSNQRVEAFPVFGPKALAGIGDLPETIADRSVPIRLRRRARSENVQRGRFRTIVEAGTPVREAAAQWAQAKLEELRRSEPVLPEEIADRAQDGAEPLLAIADLAGGEWPKRARLALTTLHGEKPEEGDSWGVQLLADIRDALGDEDRIATAELLERLKADEEKPWAAWGEHGLNPRNLARLLTPYGIRSRSIRQPDGSTPKGFKFDQLEDAFTRYVSGTGSVAATTATTAAQSQKRAVSEAPHGESVADENRPQTRSQSQSGGVADKRPHTGVGA